MKKRRPCWCYSCKGLRVPIRTENRHRTRRRYIKPVFVFFIIFLLELRFLFLDDESDSCSSSSSTDFLELDVEPHSDLEGRILTPEEQVEFFNDLEVPLVPEVDQVQKMKGEKFLD